MLCCVAKKSATISGNILLMSAGKGIKLSSHCVSRRLASLSFSPHSHPRHSSYHQRTRSSLASEGSKWGGQPRGRSGGWRSAPPRDHGSLCLGFEGLGRSTSTATPPLSVSLRAMSSQDASTGAADPEGSKQVSNSNSDVLLQYVVLRRDLWKVANDSGTYWANLLLHSFLQSFTHTHTHTN